MKVPIYFINKFNGEDKNGTLFQNICKVFAYWRYLNFKRDEDLK